MVDEEDCGAAECEPDFGCLVTGAVGSRDCRALEKRGSASAPMTVGAPDAFLISMRTLYQTIIKPEVSPAAWHPTVT